MEPNDFTNLRQHRSEVDAWTPRESYPSVGARTAVATIVGAALVIYGATRGRSNPGIWWLISGAVVGCAAARFGERQWRQNSHFGSEPADLVTQESLDSFPASDAPSSNATTTAPQPPHDDL